MMTTMMLYSLIDKRTGGDRMSTRHGYGRVEGKSPSGKADEFAAALVDL